jgi:hypothetical protein
MDTRTRPDRVQQSPAAPPQDHLEARSEVTVIRQQVAGIDRFNRARQMAEEAAQAAARSREMRMDLARRLEVLRRQHDAVVDRTEHQLRESVDVLAATARRTVLLAHRNEWFVDKLTTGLRGCGLHVIAHLDNGADAIGVAIAEQPDLMLVEDTLAMVPGEQVLHDVLQFCDSIRVIAQVAHADRVGAFLDAGAVAVHTRQVPPAVVVATMSQLLTA